MTRVLVLVFALVVCGGLAWYLATSVGVADGADDRAELEAPTVLRLHELADERGYSGLFWLQYSGDAGRPPQRQPLDNSLQWARVHARQILLEVGGVEYSAGVEPLRELPVWDDELEVRARYVYEPPGSSFKRWWVELSVDGDVATEGLAAALRASSSIADVEHRPNSHRLRVLVEADGHRPVTETVERAYLRWEAASLAATSSPPPEIDDDQTRAFESERSRFSLKVLDPG